MNSEKVPTRVGVYAPELQGFYFGELIGQIQQLCMIKGYHFHLIHTDGCGEFNSPIISDHLDIAIVLRNAITNECAQNLLDRGIAVVSIAHDYFPLDVPVVSCDNDMGIELAFNFLLKKGHRKIAYIGDLTQFDLRKRYEAFCDQYEINQIEHDDSDLIMVENALFSGGYAAAETFIKRKMDVTAIIFGSGLTSLGFAQQMRRISERKLSELELMAFDSISLIPSFETDIHIIDPNLHLIANEAIKCGELKLKSIDVVASVKVTPKLIAADSELIDSKDAFLATSVELSDIYNANYMKSIIGNFHVFASHIARSGLKDLMMIESFFPRYVKNACFARILVGNDGAEYTKTKKIFTLTSSRQLGTKERGGICLSQEYPIRIGEVVPENHSHFIHMPIKRNDAMWGVLTIMGDVGYKNIPSSLLSLCGILNAIMDLCFCGVRQKTVVEDTRQIQASEQTAVVGEIVWARTDNSTLWNDEALALLGLTTDVERNIYRYMDITDRIHQDDEMGVRVFFQSPEDTNFSANVRFKHKSKAYLEYFMECEKDQAENKVVCRVQMSESSDDHN